MHVGVPLKPFATLLLQLFSLFTFAQSDSDYVASRKLGNGYGGEVGFFIGTGYYDIKQIDSGLYKSSGTQLSYGVSYGRLVGKRIWGWLRIVYTSDLYNYQDYDPATVYWEPPTMKKEFAVLDFGLFVGYNFGNNFDLKLQMYGGYFTGFLIKGRDVIKGIYSTNYPFYPSGPEAQFNSAWVVSPVVGFAGEYYFSNHFGIELRLEWGHFFKPIEIGGVNNDNLLSFSLGVNYRSNYAH